MQDGVLAVGVPIDMPFTELNRLLEPQLKGRHFPEDGSGPVDVEVLGASLAASGDRLLISLRVKAREKKSWFGFGTDATVHIWGKPVLDPIVSNQITALQARLRNDPTIERSAREQWTKMCRSIPLGGEKTGLPPLWLEMRPVRAAAAQPQVDARNVTITIGVQAETRILPNETKPNCPFPAQLELVPPMQDGVLAVGVPIDMPFTELNRLIEPQLKGRHFPEDGSGPVDVEVLGASLAAAGNRLLISLRVKAREKKSWFGFGTEATVHIWGKPVLDQQNQIMRLTDISLAVESEAAFGLLGTAARAAMPYVQKALADKAVIDLKPFANDARAKIAAALREFQQSGSNGVRVDASVNGLRLTGIEFDANTLRVIAEANGAVKVAVTQLPRT